MPKVRAEKRACFKSLPDILAFNTMRYSFNMVTMMKEKVDIIIKIVIIIIKTIIQVNTHFSFPFQLDMSAYMEHTLMPGKAQQAPAASPIYELIGKIIIIVKILITMIALYHELVNIIFIGVITMIIFIIIIIGVTVHTGNADGGHYYAFARFHHHHHQN